MMKRLRISFALAVGLTAVTLGGIAGAHASGTCPPAPGDIDGLIRCGHMTCTTLTRNAAYVLGGSCHPATGYTCCVNGNGLTSVIEGASAGATVRMTHPNGQPFSYLPGAVEMRSASTGELLLRGVYRRGEFHWQDGTTSEDALECTIRH